MNNSIRKGLLLLFLFIHSISQVKGQTDSTTSDDSALVSLTKLFKAVYQEGRVDINTDPINICFLKEGEKYVGFIVAGHASHEVCQVASLNIKKILDSVGYKENTIFSFGVAFDDRSNDWNSSYNALLANLEKDFRIQEERYPFQIHVQNIPYSEFKRISLDIISRIQLSVLGMRTNDSLNRIIFRYYNIDFPVPIPFYEGDTVVSFAISANDIGSIPNFREFESDLLKRALDSINTAIRINNIALRNLESYNVISSSVDFDPISYPLTISNGTEKSVIKDFLQFNSYRVVRTTDANTGSVIHYYSLSEMAAKCASGESDMRINNGRNGTKRVNPCDVVKHCEELISTMMYARNQMIDEVNKLNVRLLAQKNELEGISAQLKEVKITDNTSLYIDAFLRGWRFQTGINNLNVQMDNWFKKRPIVWAKILAQNKLFNSPLGFKDKKTTSIKPKLKNTKIPVSSTPSSTNIAGIFQASDVFFAVKKQGDNYIITPYKMLTGNFIQIIDRNNGVCQFVSENNHRQTKL